MVESVLAPLIATRLLSILLSIAADVAADAPVAEKPPTAVVAAPARVDPMQPVKDAILRALAVARRGGPAEKAQPGASAVDRFLCALTEPDDEVAWPIFKQLSLEAPREPWGEIGMAHVYVRWRIRDQAEQSLTRALRLDPEQPVALVEQAIGARVFGDPASAKSLAERVLARDPNDARALLLLAQLAEDAGASQSELQAAYQRALDASSDLYEAHLWMASQAEQSGDSAGSLQAMEALAQMNPRDAAIERKLGSLRRARGDNAGAAQAYESAAALGDASQETYSGLASAKHALGDAAGEEQALRRLRRLDPKDRTVIARIFNLRLAAHDEPGMEEQARALLAIDSKDAGAHFVLAKSRAEAGDVLGQLDELDQAANGNAHPEAKNAPDRARTELAALRIRLHLPAQPLTAASPDGVYRVTSKHLAELYDLRRAEKPELQGNLAVQLKISSAGSADAVEISEDTLHDPALAQELVAALHEGAWPKVKKTLTLKYELAPPGTRRVVEEDHPRRARAKPIAAEPPPPPRARPDSAAGLAAPSESK